MEQAMMKRIVEGMTYNTDTATLLAWTERKKEREELYQTRGGAFFQVRRPPVTKRGSMP
jgi:hypothetical protein